MQMTKKITSIVLAVLMVVSMMSVMAVSTASAADFVAQDVTTGTKYESLEEAIAKISTVTSEYHSKSGLTINKYKANGTIKLLADCEGNGIVIDSGSNLTIDFDGHTYNVNGGLVGSNGTETNGFQLLQNSDVTFKNGTITSDKAKFLVQNYSNLTLDNMTLTLNNSSYSSAYTLSNNNGNTVIKDSTINANPAGGYAFDVCRYSSYPSVSVTVNGASVINGNVEISASGSDAKDGFSLTLESGTMTGDIVVDASAKSLIGEDNKVTKKDTFAKDAPAGYAWVDNGDGTSSLVAKKYVAQIGDNKYETLEAAFAAAEDGNTITLLADCAGNGIKVTPEGKFTTGLTVDFDGHTYTVDGETVGSTGTETNGFQLLKNNKVTFENGTITSAKAKILVQNYSDLTLNKMTLTLNNSGYSSAYTLSNNNGNTVINNSTINANPAGGYAFDVCRFSSYPSVSVTVTGDDSVINGNVEISASGSDAKDGFSLTLESGTLHGDIILDKTAQNVIDATPEKAEVTKKNTFNQEAPLGYEWVDNGDGTSKLAPATTNPLDALMDKVADNNKFGIKSQYLAGTILGVQRKDKASVDAPETSESKQESGNDMRFVAVLDTNILGGADDYGFVLAKVGSNKDIESVGNEGLDKLKRGDDRFKTISAKNTYNTVCGTSTAAKKYGDPADASTAYKYITCAVNGVDDSSKIVARFYVVKDGKTYYAKYAGHNYKYRGAVAGMSDLG